MVLGSWHLEKLLWTDFDEYCHENIEQATICLVSFLKMNLKRSLWLSVKSPHIRWLARVGLSAVVIVGLHLLTSHRVAGRTAAEL